MAPVPLDELDRRSLAAKLGLHTLPKIMADGIGSAIASFQATRVGCADTTVGNTKAALAELVPGKRDFDAAVRKFANPCYGVDSQTSARLQPLAAAALAGGDAERTALASAAQRRAEELTRHPRIETRTEPMRLFCGVSRLIFDACAAPDLERSRRNCRAFVHEMLNISGVDCANFDAHPERLDELMLSEVPDCPKIGRHRVPDAYPVLTQSPGDWEGSVTKNSKPL